MTDSIWVRTEPTLTGRGFMVVIEVDDDTAVTLKPDQARGYAMTVLEEVARAEYDAAVLRQITDVANGDRDAARQIVRDLRNDRPDLGHKHTAPLVFRGGVGAESQQAAIFLARVGEDEPFAQWTTEAATGHAVHVLHAITAADLDAGYLRALTGLVGVDEGRARSIIDDLQRWR